MPEKLAKMKKKKKMRDEVRALMNTLIDISNLQNAKRYNRELERQIDWVELEKTGEMLKSAFRIVSDTNGTVGQVLDRYK